MIISYHYNYVLFEVVMVISREFKCCSGCCWCAGCCDHCAFELTIEAPAGHVIGYVKQTLVLFDEK